MVDGAARTCKEICDNAGINISNHSAIHFWYYVHSTRFFINLVWFDIIFYGWVKVKEQIEGEDK